MLRRERPDPDSRRGIDARAYYEDYESPEVDYDSGGTVGDSAQPQMAAEDSAAVSRRSRPAPNEDNFFHDHGTSGFVDTATDARSTFALDVDTGSYGVARNLLDQGYRVPRAGIRVEEWVNAFEYDDPAPTDADLGLTTETGLAPTLDDGTQLVRVGVSAREVAAADRPRVNITLVVDRSGSMDIRERLGLVQSSLALLADRLNPDDTVSVVSFEDKARPLLPPTPVRDTDAILDAIEELKPGGSTNLEAGLRLGYEQAREAFDPEAVNLVVLASDGVANVGHTGPNSIVDTIQEEGADGIHLVTVGYGLGNYNDHLMEQLADLGDGFYAYVDTYAEAEQLFGEDLVTTLTPVAGGGAHPGRVRSRAGDVVPADRLRQPRDRRRGLHRRRHRRGRAGRRPPRDRALRGAARRRCRAGRGDRHAPRCAGRRSASADPTRGPQEEAVIDVVAADDGGRAVVPARARGDRRRPGAGAQAGGAVRRPRGHPRGPPRPRPGARRRRRRRRRGPGDRGRAGALRRFTTREGLVKLVDKHYRLVNER